MKLFKRLSLSVLCLIAVLFVNAQEIKEILKDKESPLVYYGIDFTHARLIGDAGANAKDVVERQFAGINDLVVNESKKYDIAGAFKRASVDIELGPVAKRNVTADPESLISHSSEDFKRISEKEVAQSVKALDAGAKTGTGILFVVDGMSKIDKAIGIWVTLFDIKSKKIIHTERMEGKLGAGFSFRNYWATGLKKVIDEIGSKKYKEWTK